MIQQWLRPAASAHAAMLDAVLVSVHTHMAIIFAGWLALFLLALVRFRRGASPEPSESGVRGLWAAIAIGAVILGDVFILATQALPSSAASDVYKRQIESCGHRPLGPGRRGRYRVAQ